jgi:ribosomal protein L2
VLLSFVYPFSCMFPAAFQRSLGLFRTSSSALKSTFPTTQTRCYATELSQHRGRAPPPTSSNKPLVRIVGGFKTFKPISPGLRHLRQPYNPHLWPGKPVRLLTVAKRGSGGRNSDGRITVRHQGGGHRRRIRLVDFRRMEGGVCDVVRIEYDPGRSGHIALVRNRELVGEKRWSYILACEGLRAGDVVQSFRGGIPKGLIPGFDEEAAAEAARNMAATKSGGGDATQDAGQTASAESLAVGILRSLTIKPGNVLPLKLIPTGTIIHNISLKPLGPAILVRSAGSWGQVMLHEEGRRYSQVRLQSGEVRRVLSECCATVGKVSNGLHKNRSLGKAGRARWLGIRPSVRGVAMNKCVFLGKTRPSGLSSTNFWLLAGAITRTVVAEANQNRTSTLSRRGGGEQRVRGRENRGREGQRTVIRWLLLSDPEAPESASRQIYPFCTTAATWRWRKL